MAVRAPQPFRELLVPVTPGSSSEQAMAIACQLAADRGSSITILSAIEVPPELPLDARMAAEEAAARQALVEAQAVAELYGVESSARLVRARSAGEAIVECALAGGTELLVLGAPRRRRSNGRAQVFGRTVAAVLAQAPCRVMVAAR